MNGGNECRVTYALDRYVAEAGDLLLDQRVVMTSVDGLADEHFRPLR